MLVYSVDLGQQGAEGHMGPVVKYSLTKYALANAERLKLATAQHFRDYAGSGSGVRDENEAVYVESLRSYLRKWNPEALPLLKPSRGIARVDSQAITVGIVPSGSVTYRVDGQWIFCTSFSPRSRGERIQMCREFDADCATWYSDPAELACELGSAFGQMSPAPPVVLDEWFHRFQDSMLRSESSFDRVVHVRHGPVVYTDDAESLIEAVPLNLRSAAVPFLKSTEYAHQREYRFTASTIGTPAQSILLVPVPTELRTLSTVQEQGVS